MRLIDADALMREFAEFVRASNNSDFADVPTWNDAVSLLGCAPTIDRPQGEWMPVKDRLPEVSKMVYEGSEWMQPISFADYFLLSDWVLVTADADSSDGDDTEIFVARYEDDLDGRTYWITVGARLLNNVTAWMPLPKPWKGAENEE